MQDDDKGYTRRRKRTNASRMMTMTQQERRDTQNWKNERHDDADANGWPRKRKREPQNTSMYVQASEEQEN
jgi:hypothetical protein